MSILKNSIMMIRTTIRIQSSLLDTLKERAHKNKRSVASELEDVVRRGLVAPQNSRERVELPVFHGGTGALRGVDLTDTSQLLELSEEL